MISQFLNERDLDVRQADGAYALYQLHWQAAQDSFDIERGDIGKALAHKAIGYLLTKGMDDGQVWQLEGNLMVSTIDKGLIDIAVNSDLIRQDRHYALDLVKNLVGNDQARTLGLCIIAKELANEASASSLEKAQSIFDTLTVKLPGDFPRPDKDTPLGREMGLKANWLADACLANMRYASLALELNDRANLSRALKGCLAVFDELEGLCKYNGWAGDADEDEDWQAECHNELDATASNLVEWAGEKRLSGFLDIVVHRATTFFSPVYERFEESGFVDEDDDEDGDDLDIIGQELAAQFRGTALDPEEKMVMDEDSPWEDLPQGDLTRTIRAAIGQIFLSSSLLHRDANELIAPDASHLERLL